MCWSFSAQHWISKYKNILVIGILQAGKLHEFGVWIKRPLRKKNTAHAHSLLSCPSTSLEILLSKQHVLLPAFDLIVLWDWCLYISGPGIQVSWILFTQAQVYLTLYDILIFGVQIQTTNYQSSYFVVFFFSVFLCYMVQWYHTG